KIGTAVSVADMREQGRGFGGHWPGCFVRSDWRPYSGCARSDWRALSGGRYGGAPFVARGALGKFYFFSCGAPPRRARAWRGRAASGGGVAAERLRAPVGVGGGGGWGGGALPVRGGAGEVVEAAAVDGGDQDAAEPFGEAGERGALGALGQLVELAHPLAGPG